MATTTTGSPNEHSWKRPGVKRVFRHSLKVDMTPMVDLGFLLIAFFVMTAELSKPSAMDLYMPKDSKEANDLGKSYALTILLNAEHSYYYHGDWNEAVAKNEMHDFESLNNIRAVIMQKQKLLDDKAKFKEGREGLMLLVKPSANADYRSVVDMLDEAAISMVKKYAIIKLSAVEKEWLSKKE